MVDRLHVLDLRCEYKKNPVGIDERKPRLSWKLASRRRGVTQTAYRIQVSAEPSFQNPVWDTGRRESDRSLHVEYEGTELVSGTRYYFRVKVWDDAGRESDWSETAFWETALLSAGDWSARWIAAPGDESKDDRCDYFRKSFTVQGEVVQARIYATALGLYRLYVNGRPADDTLFAPGWTSYNRRLQYQTYDVTALLAPGENVIGAVLGNGWYKGPLSWDLITDVYGDRRALLLQLHVTYRDGTQARWVSDSSWRCAKGPLLYSEIYHGDTYDARLEQPGWNRPGFAAGADWRPVAVVEPAVGALVAQENDPARIVKELHPIGIIRTPGGDTVIDMGQNMVGWVRFTVREAEGTAIRLQHAEVLDREGNFYTGNLRKARQTVTYICRGGGPETYEPFFSFQGFRYVKVEGVTGELSPDDFVGCVIHTDMDPTGTFRCSDELVNKLYENIVWGQRGNFLDVPTDCPQRDERLGWTGDAQVFIRTAAFQFQVAPFFEKWLRDLAADQRPDGCVPHVVPSLEAAGFGSSAWGDAAVICPWTLYECYGDTRVLERQYPSMKAWVEYIRSQGEEECLWNTGFHYGDWLGLDGKPDNSVGATPKDLIATAFYARSAEIVARTADLLGYREDAEAYAELHRRVVEAFRREFVTPNGRLASPTQTAYALALMFDLLEERHRPRAAKMLAELIEANDTHLTTGFVGTPYLCFALSRFGYADLALRLVLQRDYPSWLYPVTQGATTVWEHWDGIKPDGSFWDEIMNSFNHYAYGSIGDWLYRRLAGLDADASAAGYRRIRVHPFMDGAISSAEASLASMYGTIRVGWNREDDGAARLDAVIPPNTTAVVILPGADPETVRERGRRLEDCEGVRSVSVSEDGVTVEVGSGEYEFVFVKK